MKKRISLLVAATLFLIATTSFAYTTTNKFVRVYKNGSWSTDSSLTYDDCGDSHSYTKCYTAYLPNNDIDRVEVKVSSDTQTYYHENWYVWYDAGDFPLINWYYDTTMYDEGYYGPDGDDYFHHGQARSPHYNGDNIPSCAKVMYFNYKYTSSGTNWWRRYFVC